MLGPETVFQPVIVEAGYIHIAVMSPNPAGLQAFNEFTKHMRQVVPADDFKLLHVGEYQPELRLKGRVHAAEARLLRAHTQRRIKFTLPGPMTIVDTVADRHYGDRVKLAFAFAELLNQEARALEADGIDIVQFMYPGIIAQVVLTTSLFAGVSIVTDREAGFLRDMSTHHGQAVDVGDI